MRCSFAILAGLFGVLVLATPATADSTKTITAVSSASCQNDQLEIAAVFVITKIDSAPTITVFMENNSGDFAATSFADNTATYKVSLTTPIDRGQMATATASSSWDGAFTLQTVTCQDINKPNVSVSSSQCSSDSFAYITVAVKNNNSTDLHFTVEIESFSYQTATIAAGEKNNFSFGPAANGSYDAVVSWANDNVQKTVKVNCSRATATTPATPSTTKTSPLASASASVEIELPSIEASTYAHAAKTTEASSGKKHQFFNVITVTLTTIGLSLFGIGAYMLWYLHKKKV